MIQNPSAWIDDFYNYDYIGAIFLRGVVGNGGFSMRSRLFAEVMSQVDMTPHNPQKTEHDNEDVLFCYTYKNFFQMRGVRYAPSSIASRFSTEHIATDELHFTESFGFHEIERLSDGYVQEHRRAYLRMILNENTQTKR